MSKTLPENSAKREFNYFRDNYCDYPVVGLAPHGHPNVNKPEELIGSTKYSPKDKWPENFEEDKDAPGIGTYDCPYGSCNIQCPDYEKYLRAIENEPEAFADNFWED